MPERIIEIFGHPTQDRNVDWKKVVGEAQCPYIEKRCWKTRKSESTVAIGTCSIRAKKDETPIMICPSRLGGSNRIFSDAIPLLTRHVPGNDLHLVSEFSTPAGNIDFVLCSVRLGKVEDFVGIELQTLDTTGSAFDYRQEFLHRQGMDVSGPADMSLGLNWKMTSKTILGQMVQKAQQFRDVERSIVLVIQKPLLDRMRKDFALSHFALKSRPSDTVHFHAYDFFPERPSARQLEFSEGISTDVAGIAKVMGRESEVARTESELLDALTLKISHLTLFEPLQGEIAEAKSVEANDLE